MYLSIFTLSTSSNTGDFYITINRKSGSEATQCSIYTYSTIHYSIKRSSNLLTTNKNTSHPTASDLREVYTPGLTYSYGLKCLFLQFLLTVDEEAREDVSRDPLSVRLSRGPEVCQGIVQQMSNDSF